MKPAIKALFEQMKAEGKVLDNMPEGWKISEGARTAPDGYYWANNGGNIFKKGDYQHALIKK